MNDKVIPIGVKPKKAKFSKKNMANSNIAQRTREYWDLSSACRSPMGRSGVTFEEATKKINKALKGLGPHRKAVRRFNELQYALITGAGKCPNKKRSTTSPTSISEHIESKSRIQQTPTPPSQ